MKKKNLKLISIAGATAAFTAVFCTMALNSIPDSTATIKATDFQAGRIIDDEIFYNSNTMTVSQIQAHLDKYLPECDMWGKQPIGRGRSVGGKAVDANLSRAEYAKLVRENGNSNYHEPPYVCVNKYYENPTTHETLYETKGEIKEGMVSAAQIIYDSAKEYGINPQVLLVLLKKESYVWGDSWPLKWEYDTVMGYACPDGAPCDTKYFGFYNQVKTAAWQLKYYKEHINSYNYHPYKTNNILYSPDRSCGRKSVYLENVATTSLYIYTPYTPNDAALANYPGTATCGSYGNRNFFMYFAEWFGNPLVDKSATTKNEEYEAVISKDKIGAKMIASYKELGNNSETLGKLISDKVFSDGRGMYWINYENGFIVGTEKTGFYESHGLIRDVWAKANYQNGKYGLPIRNIVRDNNTKTYWQRYQNGFIFCSEKDGCFESLFGKIRDAWARTGFQSGTLGAPADDVYTSGKLSWQRYQNGFVIGSDKTGFYESRGPIRDAWEKANYQDGKYGLPVSDIARDDNTKTYWQRYQNGFIFCTDQNGCFESMFGGIRNAWAKTGYQNGALGSPNSNIQSSGKISWQSYQNGFIIGSEKTGFYESRGPIRDAWASTDFERGKLGLPTSNIIYNASAKTHTQTFEGGQISYDESTNKTTVSYKTGQ